jgi:hypothetical protein
MTSQLLKNDIPENIPATPSDILERLEERKADGLDSRRSRRFRSYLIAPVVP